MTSALLLCGLPAAVRAAATDDPSAPPQRARRAGQEGIDHRLALLLETAEQRTIAGHLTSPIDGSAATLLVELTMLVPSSSLQGRRAATDFLAQLRQDAERAAASGNTDQQADLTILAKMIASSLDFVGLPPAPAPGAQPAPPTPDVGVPASMAGAESERAASALQLLEPAPDPAPPPDAQATGDVPGREPAAGLQGVPTFEAEADGASAVHPSRLPDAAITGASAGSEPAPGAAEPAAQAGPPDRSVAEMPDALQAPARDAAPDDGRERADPVLTASLPPAEPRVDFSRPPVPSPVTEASPPAAAAGPEEPPLPAAIVDVLMKRGAEMVAVGDISAARRLYERAALSGNAAAAAAAGRMYDPDVLAGIHVQGIRPDPEKARHWYRQAVALGASDAATRLQALTTASTR